MTSSQFASEFIQQLRDWESKLTHIKLCINAWLQVQEKWVYLENIFMGKSEDIRNQLQEATKRFERVDQQWKKIMFATAKNPNVLQACTVRSRRVAGINVVG